MSINPNREENKSPDNQIISPFAQTTSNVSPMFGKTPLPWLLWVVSALLVCIIFGSIGYFSYKYVHNPYRTLEPFSVDQYLTNYQPLAGSKFKADFKVVADLGWKDGIGRLMVFSATGDTRPIPVLIPPKLASVFFSKDQTYQVSLEVGEGGLIYAISCDKE